MSASIAPPNRTLWGETLCQGKNGRERVERGGERDRKRREEKRERAKERE